MNPDSEKFDALRRALALKRHEQPPPGYFDRFSRNVMARIKAGETGGETGLELPWMRRVLAMFDMKPAFAGVFGAAVCVLLVTGVVSSSTPSVATNPSAPDVRNSVADISPSGPAVEPPSVVMTGNSNAMAVFEEFQPRINALAHDASERYWVPNGN